MADVESPSYGRRRFDRRVVGLFFVVVSVGMVYLSISIHAAFKKTVEQRQTIAVIESLGGNVQTKFGGSGNNWVRRNLVENSVLVVNLSDTQFNDVSLLEGLKSLCELDLSGTQVTDLKRLAKLERLNSLNLANTPISDLTPLSKLVRLVFLDISGTQVRNISMLKDLRGIEELNLANTEIKDASPLIDLEFLRQVDLSNTKIPLHEIHRLKQAKPHSKIILDQR